MRAIQVPMEVRAPSVALASTRIPQALHHVRSAALASTRAFRELSRKAVVRTALFILKLPQGAVPSQTACARPAIKDPMAALAWHALPASTRRRQARAHVRIVRRTRSRLQAVTMQRIVGALPAIQGPTAALVRRVQLDRTRLPSVRSSV